jgi:hypothetical protein
MASDTVVRARIDGQVKKEAAKVLAERLMHERPADPDLVYKTRT